MHRALLERVDHQEVVGLKRVQGEQGESQDLVQEELVLVWTVWTD
jgi:hypothetical protein